VCDCEEVNLTVIITVPLIAIYEKNGPRVMVRDKGVSTRVYVVRSHANCA